MSGSTKLGVRRSVYALQNDYVNGLKQPLEDLVRAWKAIKELPPTDHRSYLMIAGYHGEPFQYRRQVDALSDTDTYQYWGGYCNHGNVLFPTWHRVYVFKLEKALQSVVPGVMQPYWDETSEETRRQGIPWVLTAETFELDGEVIANPLRSFVLPVALSDHLWQDDKAYEKPKGYETVRYPLSGLVGTPEARAMTKTHNAAFPNATVRTELLDDNIRAWLHGRKPDPKDPDPTEHGVLQLYRNCLDAPNYTVFSNTTSAAQWSDDHPGAPVTPLESPHNDIHLAVGGFDIPDQGEDGQIAGANGDMGENNTAGMDPIFFFHHSFIDRMFWLWQRRHGKTTELEIVKNYAGTNNAADGQGPTPGQPPGLELAMDTPLNPFVIDDFGTLFTSSDCVDIEGQLGYTYEAGSLEDEAVPSPAATRVADPGRSAKTLVVSGIDRATFQGSFVLRAYASVTDESGVTATRDLGHYSVLSRRNLVRCANCLTHLEVRAYFPLSGLSPAEVETARFWVEVQHRGPDRVHDFPYQVEVRG
jgi:tyrosinase